MKPCEERQFSGEEYFLTFFKTQSSLVDSFRSLKDLLIMSQRNVKKCTTLFRSERLVSQIPSVCLRVNSKFRWDVIFSHQKSSIHRIYDKRASLGSSQMCVLTSIHATRTEIYRSRYDIVHLCPSMQSIHSNIQCIVYSL